VYLDGASLVRDQSAARHLRHSKGLLVLGESKQCAITNVMVLESERKPVRLREPGMLLMKNCLF
jgi:hypothetical protein